MKEKNTDAIQGSPRALAPTLQRTKRTGKTAAVVKYVCCLYEHPREFIKMQNGKKKLIKIKKNIKIQINTGTGSAIS